MRRTKIICTLGPAVNNEKKLERLIKTGFDVARFNFSHGSYKEHGERMDLLKRVSRNQNKDIAILLDTKGPEIRTGEVDGRIFLKKGNLIILTTKIIKGSTEKISITYKNLPKEVKPKDQILLDDGLIELEVISIDKNEIFCIIKNSGELGSCKGVNLPNIHIKLPGISEKDKKDILFGLEKNIHFLALSFVREKKDINEARKILREAGKHIQVIAKIETAIALENLDDIIEASDGVMIARGDLGVEIPAMEVPIVQKMIIRKARLLGKPVIVATQMLDSMIRNTRPTRAEVSDVANSILDGTDAIMLSGETAVGRYPIEALKMMNDIAKETEKDLHLLEPMHFKDLKKSPKLVDMVAYSTVDIGKKIKAKALVVPTHGGSTVRRIARYRPNIPIIALIEKSEIKYSLKLVWGVESLLISSSYKSTDDLIYKGESTLLKQKKYKLKDKVVFTAGIPIKVSHTTNMIRILELGKSDKF